MRFLRAFTMLLAVLAMPLAAQAPNELKPVPPLVPAKASERRPGEKAPIPPAQLTKAHVDAWLDGYLPYALDTGDIAGAVLIVIKDGQVLTERGFGYADVKARTQVDPAATLFRPGSISKLFTWTAVMQLVQAGKLDLDRDVNDYLDFKIPPAFGKPVTLRNIMTHTAGFEETAKYLLLEDPKKSVPLDVALKRWVPTRIYAPGSMPAYSNYAASLAGYIVQRVSGEPFDDYLQHHIFTPLGMNHSTFVQPLPPALAGGMAKGYTRASADPQAFEIIDLAPAGAMSTTGDDMSRFMLAHLANGGLLLNPQTARLMHAAANTPIPGLPAMALGFYHEDRNGLTIIGHGGDTDVFHSDLHLYLDKGVGLFLSFNSAGKEGAAHVLRERLFDDFTDRYFPYAAPTQPTLASAKTDGAAMVGHYVSSRGSNDNFLSLVGLLGEAKVALNSDDTISVSALTTPAGVPKKWREVAQFQWQEVGGSDRLAAKVENGHVVMFAPAGFAPIFEFLPAPASLDAGWVLPLALAALAITLLTALSWPVVALVRRRYRFDAGVDGRGLLLHRTSRITAWLILAVTAGWMAVIASFSNVSNLDGRLDGWMRLLQLLLVLAIVGTLVAIWNAVEVIGRPGRHRFASVWNVLFTLAALFLVWLAVHVNLLTASLSF